MKDFKLEDNVLKIEMDITELAPQQVRLIKSINTMLKHISTTDDESDYFESCSELMKLIASLVKQAHFTGEDKIAYAEQALEYSFDSITDIIHSPKLNTYDN